MEPLLNALNAMKQRISALMKQLNITGKAEKLAAVEAQTTAPDFWNDPDAAQKTMQEMSKLKDEVEQWQGVASRIDDALELVKMGDADLLEDLQSEVESLRPLVEKLSLRAMLSGQYDNSDAILAIHAGTGGTESQDWAAMLERMYLRWAEQNGFKVEMLERSDGEEAGIKSVMYAVRGAFAFGYLQSEIGVHRLVRISPFDAASRRHTSFVKVEVWPDIQGDIDIEVHDKDLRIETYRSGGAGGQHMQKNDTAVRMTHMPTGIVVAVQNERSQAQNRERAMQVLKSRLFEMERKKREAQLAQLKGENVDAAWGNQIRSYVLHPYQMIKDHRTDYEVGNTGAVLDGRLNDFMEAYLRYKIGATTPTPVN